MTEITDILVEIASQLDLRFTLYGTELTLEEIFSPMGMLPVLAKKANADCLECLGYGIGISFQEQDSALLGYEVLLDTIAPTSLKLLFLLDVLMVLQSQTKDEGEVVLDGLVYKFS